MAMYCCSTEKWLNQEVTYYQCSLYVEYVSHLSQPTYIQFNHFIQAKQVYWEVLGLSSPWNMCEKGQHSNQIKPTVIFDTLGMKVLR
jgi:hypothetical protein